jgi:hypothetical protein
MLLSQHMGDDDEEGEDDTDFSAAVLPELLRCVRCPWLHCHASTTYGPDRLVTSRT